MKLAANCTLMFTEHPFLDRFSAARAAGFRGVEFLFPYDQPAAEVAGRVQAAGVEVALFNLPPGDWAAGERGVSALPGREADFAAAIRTGLEYALALKCSRVHAMAGLVPAGAERSAYEATFVRNLRAAADAFAPHGIDVLIEPLNARDVPGYLVRTTGEALEAMVEIDRPNVRLQLDLYHLQISEGDLAHRMRALWGTFAHVQIAGNPDRNEPSRGEVNYGYLLTLLDELGYAGWVGCEYRPFAGTLAGLAWAHAYGVVPGSASK